MGGQVEGQPPVNWKYDPAADAVRQGVWAVWTDSTREHLYIVFPANQELECRRWSDEQGYGWVEFITFGEQL